MNNEQLGKRIEHNIVAAMYEQARKAVHLVRISRTSAEAATYSTYEDIPVVVKNFMLAHLMSDVGIVSGALDLAHHENNFLTQFIMNYVRETGALDLLYRYAHEYNQYQIDSAGMDNGAEHYIPEDLMPMYEQALSLVTTKEE